MSHPVHHQQQRVAMVVNAAAEAAFDPSTAQPPEVDQAEIQLTRATLPR